MTINEFGRRSFVTWTTGLKEKIQEAEKEIQMRQYRGLTKEGKLVYGWYVEIPHKHHFIIVEQISFYHYQQSSGQYPAIYNPIEVIPETVEQSTGLKDKNGTEGYRADKVSFGSTRPIYLIKWSICNAGFYLESMNERKEHLVISNLTVGEIIGNIHQEQDNG